MDALTAFGMKAADATEFTDILSMTATKSNTNVSMLGESFKYVAPLAGSLGISAKDTSFALGLMANSGIKGSQAGTSLKTSLVNLTKPTKAMQGVMSQLGITMLDSNGEVKEGKDLYDHLREKIGKLPKAQQAAASATLFGKEALAGMLSVINASDDDYNSLYENLENSEGATQKMADTMSNTAEGALTSMKSAIEGAGLAIFESLEPHIIRVAKAVGSLAAKFSKLDPKLINLIVVFGAIAAAIGPVLLVVGQLLITFGGMAEVIGGLVAKIGIFVISNGGMLASLKVVAGFILGPAGIILALVTIGAALVALYKNSETFRTGVQAIWKQVKEIFKTGMDYTISVFKLGWAIIQTSIEIFSAFFKGDTTLLWEKIQELGRLGLEFVKTIFFKGFENLKQTVKLGWEGIKLIFSMFDTIMTNIVKVMLTVMQTIWNASITLLKTTITNMWTDIKKIFSNALNFILNIVSTVLTNMGNDVKRIFNAIKEFTRPVWEGIANIVSTVVNAISKVVSSVFTIMSNVIGVIFGVISSIISKAWEIIKALTVAIVNKIVEIVVQRFENLKDNINIIFTVIKNFLTPYWNTLYTFITDVVNKIKNTATDIFNKLKQSIIDIFTSIKNFFTPYWNTLYKFITDIINKIKETSTRIFESMRSSITDIFNKIKNFINGIMESVKDLMSRAWNAVRNKTDEIWKGIFGDVSKSTGNLLDNIKALPQKMADGITKGKSKLVNAFKGMFNDAMVAVGKPINAIVKGANWVLKKLGAEELDEWSVPKFAKGTTGGGHKGGLAMVNDQKGGLHQELVTLPDGRKFIPQGRNILLDLPKGTHVLNAKKTKEIYKYAKGTKGAEKKEADDGIDIMSLFSAPKKLAEAALNKFVDLKGMADYPLRVAKGLIGKVKDNLGNFLSSQFHMGEGGDYDGNVGFKGLQITSPYGVRRHPISGKTRMHTGVDYGGGQRYGHPIHAQQAGIVDFSGVMGGYGNVVRTKAGAFQHMYAHLQKRLANVGQSITRGQLIGEMGSTGNSTGPHVHYEVRQNGKHINPMASLQGSGGGSNPMGSGVERWRGTVIKALGMNGLPTSPAYVNAWLRQIHTESRGNPSAVQGNIGDVNNKSGDLAKGLVQVIGATFNRYKFPGHNNRMNGLDSLLAGMNYAKSRYGVAGMLNRIGKGKGYEKGGLINRPQFAHIGEKGKREMVVPLTDKARAMQLIQKSLKILGVEDEVTGGKFKIRQTKDQKVEEITINIDKMEVRNDRDIHEIAKALHELTQRKKRTLGGI